MSLEDKAKEYVKKTHDIEMLRSGKKLADYGVNCYCTGYTQAIKDLIERAREWTYADELEVATLDGIVKKSRIGENAITLLEELEQAAEDLIEEGEK